MAENVTYRFVDEQPAFRFVDDNSLAAKKQKLSGMDVGAGKQYLKQLYDAKDPDYGQLAIQFSDEHGFGSGAPKVAYDVGGKVTDVTGSPALGYAANVAAQAIPAFLTSFRTGDPVSVMEKPAKRLMQAAVKPAQDVRLSGKADKALVSMLRENISPTKGGMEKASKIASKMGTQVDDALKASTAEVPIDPIGQRMLPSYERALVQANPETDVKAVSDVWKEFARHPLVRDQEKIPVQIAHLLKRGTQQAVGSKAYGELGTASTDAQKALAAALREGVADAVPAVADPLARQASMMNILEVARNRAVLAGNNNLLGLGALRLGDNPLSTISFMADRWPYLQGLLARSMYRAGQPQAIAPLLMSGAMAGNQPALLGQ